MVEIERRSAAMPPHDLLDNASLFLDLDGTLLDLVDRPDQVRADTRVTNLLTRLAVKLDGRVAVVSGRSLEQIDTILGAAAGDLALSGSHGCEHRWQGVVARPSRPPALDIAGERMRAFAKAHPGVLYEGKSFGVALHYRMNPAIEAEAQALAEALAEGAELLVQRGKMMVELRAPGGDKGRAIERLMSRPLMHGTTPVFVGDDITDEDGFEAAVRLGGHGVLVGDRRPTAASFAVASPSALLDWLDEVAR